MAEESPTGENLTPDFEETDKPAKSGVSLLTE